ncbi:3-hydroxybutyryl-CoA dehydrogenase [Yinghuangia aomiensis]
MTTSLRRIGVVGGGQMGAGIAEVCARAGLDVMVCETSPDTAEQGRKRIATSLDRAVKAGKIDEPERAKALDAIRFTTSLADFADRTLVIEAASENEDVKLGISHRARPRRHRPGSGRRVHTPRRSRSRSSAPRPGAPEHVVGMHFFNPVPVQRLVEVIPSLVTSDETTRRVEEFATALLGKTVIRSQDRAGFVVNALLVPYLLSAVRMLESGFASAEDIDNGMVLGCAHPLGPLRLADLIGLDTLNAIAESMYAEFKEPLYAPPPLLLRMVEAGLIGRKSGRGFHAY